MKFLSEKFQELTFFGVLPVYWESTKNDCYKSYIKYEDAGKKFETEFKCNESQLIKKAKISLIFPEIIFLKIKNTINNFTVLKFGYCPIKSYSVWYSAKSWGVTDVRGVGAPEGPCRPSYWGARPNPYNLTTPSQSKNHKKNLSDSTLNIFDLSLNFQAATDFWLKIDFLQKTDGTWTNTRFLSREKIL